MTETPTISVVIPAFNAEHVLGEQLDALAAQVGSPPFEVVVADNGSTDGTAAIARDYRGPFDVRVVDASQRRGASHARNVGVLAARGEFVLFCDSDDFVEPEWAASLIDAHERHPNAIIRGVLDHLQANDADVLNAYTITADPPRPAPGEPTIVESPGPYSGYLPTAPGNNFAMSRELYLDAEGMDSSYPGAAEETDLVWRVQETGVPVIEAKTAIVRYRLRDTARAMFRQQRIQQFAKVLLWMRYRGVGMHGPSIRFSVVSLLKLVAQAPVRLWTRRGRLYLGRWAGGHVGALHGIWHYRVLKRLPAPELMERTDPDG